MLVYLDIAVEEAKEIVKERLKGKIMPAYLDIAARDLTSYKKGDIVGIAIKGKEGSQDPSGAFITLIISDATREQAYRFIRDWKIDFSHTLVSQNAFGWQFLIEVDPVYISASGIGRASIKSKMRSHIDYAPSNSPWNGCLVALFTANSMTVNVPKNGTYQTAKGLDNIDYLAVLKSEFRDIFRKQLLPRRYHFSEADVDQVIAAGGTITLTKVQVLNKVFDKLES